MTFFRTNLSLLALRLGGPLATPMLTKDLQTGPKRAHCVVMAFCWSLWQTPLWHSAGRVLLNFEVQKSFNDIYLSLSSSHSCFAISKRLDGEIFVRQTE